MDPITPFLAMLALFSGLVFGNHEPTVRLEVLQEELLQTKAEMQKMKEGFELKLAEKDHENAELQVKIGELETGLALAEADRKDLAQTLGAARQALGIQNTEKGALVRGVQDLELWYRSALTDIDRLHAELDKRNVLVERGMISAHKLLAAQTVIRRLESEVKMLVANERKLTNDLAIHTSLQTANRVRVATLENDLQITKSELAGAENRVKSLSKRNDTLFRTVMIMSIFVGILLMVVLIASMRRKSAQSSTKK